MVPVVEGQWRVEVIAPAPVLWSQLAAASLAATGGAGAGEDHSCPYDEVAAMTGPTDNALVLIKRAVASRDPLDLALAGFLSAYNGRTFDKQPRVIKHYVDWCLQHDRPPLQAQRPHIELFVRWCENQRWSESYICQQFIGVRTFQQDLRAR